MQRRARHKGVCFKCIAKIKRGDRIHYVPDPKARAGKKRKPGKVFCRRCVAQLHLLRFPPSPNRPSSAWLRDQETEMVERELAKATRRPIPGTYTPRGR